MQHNNKHQHIINALVQREFRVAENMAIQAINKSKLDPQLWLYLTEALAFQGFSITAKKTLKRALLLDPQAPWIDQAERDIEINDQKLERDGIDELLKVRDVTVCAALIVKNEEKHIKNCITHLLDAVDEIVIVDTGSTDKTKEFAKSFPKVKVVEFQWCDDFSAARNAAFCHITSEWVFWVDADEYLFEEDIKCVREAAALFDSFNVPVLLRVGIINEYDNAYSMSSYDAIRLFPMKYGLKYSSKIHEQIVITDHKMLIDGRMASNAVKIRLRHFGYMQSDVIGKDKINRNIKLLTEMIKEDNQNPLWYFFMGRELFTISNFQDAIIYLNNCVKLAKDAPSFGRILDAYTYLVKALLEIGNIEQAENICAEAIKINTDFPDIQYLLGLIKFNTAINDFKLAEDYVIKSKQSFETYRDIVSPDNTILDWKADLLHGDIALFASKMSHAKKIYEEVIKDCPDMVKSEVLGKLNYIQEQKIKLSGI